MLIFDCKSGIKLLRQLFRFCYVLIIFGITWLIQPVIALGEGRAKDVIQHYEETGVNVDFSVGMDGNKSPLKTGEEASIHFQIADKKSHEPIKGLSPVAWMVRSHSDGATDSKQCEQKISELHQGHLSHQPEVNLNSFLILTLNQNNTISVVNPQIAWSRTKLEAVVELLSRGDAWVLDKAKDRLYVVVPEQSSVVVIDTNNWHQTNLIKLSGTANSAQVFLQPDGRLLWVALDNVNELFALNTANQQVVARIPVGNGKHGLSGSADGQMVYVSDTASKSLSIINTSNINKISTIHFDQPASAVAVNPATGLVYVAATESSFIHVVKPEESKIIHSIPLDKGIMALRFNHDGDYAFAVNQAQNTVSLINADQHKILASTRVVEKPDQVVFSHHYAYVRGLASPQFSVFDLAQVSKGELAPATVEAGQQPAIDDADAITQLDMMAPTPDGHGAILANAPDRKLYYYMEGMMAASGSLDNGDQSARGVMILDRSLKETEPGGTYGVTFNLPSPGKYEVAFLLDKPRVTHCFPVQVKPAQDQALTTKIKPLISVVSTALKTPKDKTVNLRFKILDRASLKPLAHLHDAEMLIVSTSGHWQSKHLTTYDSVGFYAHQQKFNNPGHYLAMLRIPSLGIDYNRQNQIKIDVTP